MEKQSIEFHLKYLDEIESSDNLSQKEIDDWKTNLISDLPEQYKPIVESLNIYTENPESWLDQDLPF